LSEHDNEAALSDCSDSSVSDKAMLRTGGLRQFSLRERKKTFF